MSLDVYLSGAAALSPGTGIFTRVARNASHPDCESGTARKECDVFSANITHNLWKMAHAAGIYHHLWHPEAIGVERAGDLIKPLTAGLERLQAAPEVFRALDLQTGRGSYEELVHFVSEYVDACSHNPGASVRAFR